VGSRLPKDVSLYHVCEVAPGFRASQDAISKLYRYTIYNDPNRPVESHRQRYVYHFWQLLDVEKMCEAANYCIGKKDFAAFATQGHKRETTVRTVMKCEIHRYYNEINIDVEGDGFLYNQVRNMVGTLIEIGRGHWEPGIINDILASRDRSKAGPTAPARGLCLQWVRYDMTGVPLSGSNQYHVRIGESAEPVGCDSSDAIQ
jgi:tRNA pseudouridine38-40 synthase